MSLLNKLSKHLFFLKSRPALKVKEDLKEFHKEHTEDFEWCIIGNIVQYHYHGQHKEIKSGTKHFSANTKVYCFPKFGGSAHANMEVLGLHRKSRKFIKIIIQTKRIHNLRLKKVFNPTVLAYIRNNSFYCSNPISDDKFIWLKRLANHLNAYTEELAENSL